MILYLLCSLSLGFEAGMNQPFIGFEDLNSGVVFDLCLKRNLGFCKPALGGRATFYQGKNPGYSLNTYGVRFSCSKPTWRFSPFIEFGIEYLTREFNKEKETGFAFDYNFGFLINFRYESLFIYPKFYYEGVTDLSEQASFIGIKLGIEYEM